MARMKFVGKISSMGEKIIYIPKGFHKDDMKLKSKQVRDVVDDEFNIINKDI